MRRDIEIHKDTCDIALKSTNKYKTSPFRFVENRDGLSRYTYAEIEISATITEDSLRRNGFYFKLPYTPMYKELMIRIRRSYSNGTYVYVLNPKDNTEWFKVLVKNNNSELATIRVSEFMTISESDFYIHLEDDIAVLYSSEHTDLNIVDANSQNTSCMLKCIPTNNYRYPVTGVGLARWINAVDVNNRGLGEAIIREFTNDGVTPRNAEYNYETQQLELQLDFQNT